MLKKERIFISLILLSMSLLTIIDLINDSGDGASWWHLSLEGGLALLSVGGAYLLLRGVFRLKSSLKKQKEFSLKLEEEANRWKESSKKYLEGLSHTINDQLDLWGLTKSEKEIAFLLIKGFSLKEIADIRQTTEKTTRGQATSIYAKAGVAGRPQLSAFFLEDILLPQSE